MSAARIGSFRRGAPTPLPILALLVAGGASEPDLARAAEAALDLPSIAVSAAAPSPRERLDPSPAGVPAPVDLLAPEDIRRMPVLSYGDIFRSLPGVDVSNYGQGGVGYGISLRGFTDAEHGRDIAYFIDGVPVNEVSSIHTPNYADLNILVPETVDRIAIIRGPFSAEYGDSNLGGVVDITTKRSEPFATAGISAGSFGTVRGVGTYSKAANPIGSGGGDITPFVAAELYSTDGYRNNQDYRRFNLFSKGTLDLGQDQSLSGRFQLYGGDWGAPGYISREGVVSGALSPRAATNGTDGGTKILQNVVFNYTGGAPAQALAATGWFSHDRFDRYADFGGGQRGQREERFTTGLRGKKVWSGDFLDAVPVQLSLGGNFRGDVVNVNQEPTIGRNQSGARVVDLHYDEFGLGTFAEIQAKPVYWLKATLGARYDKFIYDTRNRLDPTNSPSASNGVPSPKAGLSIFPVSGLEVFGNYGESFRSASVPADLLQNAGIQPLKLHSKEIGAEYRPLDGVKLLADFWTTDISNEAFQAAPGLPVQNLGASRRTGFDIETRWDIAGPKSTFGGADLYAVFVNYGDVRARLVNQGASRYVPNVPAYTLNIGAEFDAAVGGPGRLSGSLVLGLIGRKNVTEDGLVRSEPYQRLAAKASYDLPNGWSFFAQGIFYPGDRNSEAIFNFGPNIAAAQSDIFVSPQPRFTGMAGAVYRFDTGIR